MQLKAVAYTGTLKRHSDDALSIFRSNLWCAVYCWPGVGNTFSIGHTSTFVWLVYCFVFREMLNDFILVIRGNCVV